jgi:alpha,alpha-trehalose-phosphate synthase [UDP-forming]
MERLIVVANRLPITVQCNGNDVAIRPSAGGLVSALVPIIKETGGSWVGWTGTDYSGKLVEAVEDWPSQHAYSLHPVFLTANEKDCYYRGFSNEIVWPLFHGFPSRCLFFPSYWKAYSSVNRRFADEVERISEAGDLIWVHDYHLMLLAQELRRRNVKQRVAYFHHIPFPAPDIFEALPWRSDVLRALLHFDLLGFQTARDQQNFVACVRRCAPEVRLSDIAVATYPISIDYAEFESVASTPQVAAAAQKIRDGMPGTKIILGVDRLDYTKGIPERLVAFQTLLESDPSWRGRVSMVQLVVPSREDIPEYMQLRQRIERLVSHINGEYSTPEWVPIHYFHRCITREELVAFYRAADVALVAPLKDGMNLVAKEFCACRTDNRGVLVLSEFAGAAQELRLGALIVNPHHTEKVAATLAAAVAMNESEQQIRMKAMRSQIETHDVFHWSQSFWNDTAIRVLEHETC